MITLFKNGKVYYKVENENLIGGQLISCPTQEVADTFKEFNSEEAREFFEIFEEFMKNLKQYVNNLQDRIVNKDIKVENGVVYIEDYIKYENQQWWLKVECLECLCKVVFLFMKLAKILTMIFLKKEKVYER